ERPRTVGVGGGRLGRSHERRGVGAAVPVVHAQRVRRRAAFLEGGALRVLVDERRRLERDRHTRGVLALDLAADLHLGRRVRAALVAAAVPVAVVTGAGAVAVAAVRSVAVAVPVRTGGGRLGGRVRVALVARAETAETDDEQAAPQRDHREDGEDL